MRASGRVWLDESQSFFTSRSSWNETNFSYVTANAFGTYAHQSGGSDITEHVLVTADTGHFIDLTRADGVFSLSVGLYQGARKIDTCRTGTVRWVADWTGG